MRSEFVHGHQLDLELRVDLSDYPPTELCRSLVDFAMPLKASKHLSVSLEAVFAMDMVFLNRWVPSWYANEPTESTIHHGESRWFVGLRRTA